MKNQTNINQAWTQLRKCLIENNFKIKSQIIEVLSLLDVVIKGLEKETSDSALALELKNIFEGLLLKEIKLNKELKNKLLELAEAIPQSGNKSEEATDLLFGEKEVLEYFVKNQSIPEEIEDLILKLEDVADSQQVIDALFRTFHTLKSEAGFLQLNNLHELSHALESFLAKVKKEKLKLESEDIDLLFSCHDKISSVFVNGLKNPKSAVGVDVSYQIASLKANNLKTAAPDKKEQAEDFNFDVLELSKIEDLDIYHDFVSESLEHLENIESKILKLEADPHNEEILNDIFRPLHTIKGISAYLNLHQINKLSHKSESYLDKLRKGEFVVKKSCIDLILKVKDVLMNLITLIKIQLNEEEIPANLVPDLKSIYEYLELCAKNQNGDFEIVEPSDKDNKDCKPVENKNEEPKSKETETQGTVVDETVKISAKKLDNLLNLVGELVISHNQISQNHGIKNLKDPGLQKNIIHASNIIRDVQQISMGLRMVPIKQTFHKMKRLVRDLCQKSEKQVELIIQGAETELDRNAIEYLNDPLIHMIRNAMDHGIETAVERKNAGKSGLASINLNAYHSSGNIVIEIRDDGRGIDVDKILESGIKKGLVSPQASLTESEILGLIFEPGFSTASKVTDISGRGVGMDVVRKNIEKLGGNISISTDLGKGSTFNLKFPLTMAIMDGMVIEVGKEQYILPVLSVKESIRPKREEIHTLMNKGEMIEIRGNLFPLVRLQGVLELEGEVNALEESIVMVIDNGGQTFGLLVDKILGQQQIVIKNINQYFGSMKGISGYTILGNGMVGLILDSKDLLELHKAGQINSEKINELEKIF